MADVFESIEENFILFRDMVREFPDRYHQNNKDIERLQQEQQDLLHVLELVPLNAYQGWKVAEQLKVIRIQRRELKDQNQLLEPLVSLLKKYRSDLAHMDKALGEVRKRERLQDVRGYRCRVREDLQESLDKNKAVSL